MRATRTGADLRGLVTVRVPRVAVAVLAVAAAVPAAARHLPVVAREEVLDAHRPEPVELQDLVRSVEGAPAVDVGRSADLLECAVGPLLVSLRFRFYLFTYCLAFLVGR